MDATIRLRQEQLRKHLAEKGITSAYALAPRMGIARSTVSRTLRTGADRAELSAKFIALLLLRVFPELRFDDLFECVDETPDDDQDPDQDEEVA